MSDTSNRCAIVTGAGRGLGRSEALELASRGIRVIVNDVDEGRVISCVDEIERAGGKATPFVGDVSDHADAEAMVSLATEKFGGLDILVNNAGILRDRMIFNMSREEWRDVLRVHLTGTFAPTRFACAFWRQKSKEENREVSGRIVNTTSRSGLFGNPGQSNYGAAKAGIATFTMIVAREMRKYGVTCNAIAPRAYTEPMRATFGEFEPDKVSEWSPDAVARFVGFLSSKDSEWISGRVFIVFGETVELVKPWEVQGRIRLPSSTTDSDAMSEIVRDLFGDVPGQIPDYSPDVDLPLRAGS